MITKLSSSKALSMHRLVQLVVLHKLPMSGRVETFGLAVRILYFGFPNTLQGGGAHQGHGWAFWEKSSEVLPHVSLLMRLSEKYKIKAPNTDF